MNAFYNIQFWIYNIHFTWSFDEIGVWDLNFINLSQSVFCPWTLITKAGICLDVSYKTPPNSSYLPWLQPALVLLPLTMVSHVFLFMSDVHNMPVPASVEICCGLQFQLCLLLALTELAWPVARTKFLKSFLQP